MTVQAALFAYLTMEFIRTSAAVVSSALLAVLVLHVIRR